MVKNYIFINYFSSTRVILGVGNVATNFSSASIALSCSSFENFELQDGLGADNGTEAHDGAAADDGTGADDRAGADDGAGVDDEVAADADGAT